MRTEWRYFWIDAKGNVRRTRDFNPKGREFCCHWPVTLTDEQARALLAKMGVTA